MKIYDCHVHTDFSFDGKSSLDEISHRAKELSVNAITITDHDFPAGKNLSQYEHIRQSVESAKRKNEELKGTLLVLSGIELSDSFIREESQEPFYKIKDINKLNKGDFVVHADYGIGKYLGIETIDTAGVVKDYIKLEYKDGGTLYIPITSLDSIKKYVCEDGYAPKMNKLGTKEWETTKEELSEMMVGRKVDFNLQKKDIKPGKEVLKVEKMTMASKVKGKNIINDVSLSVRAGEIVSIAGIDGNGQSEFVYGITGLEKINKGKIILNGMNIVIC